MRGHGATAALTFSIGMAFGLNSTVSYSNTTVLAQSKTSSSVLSSSSWTEMTSEFASPYSSHSLAASTDVRSLSTASTGSSPIQSYFTSIESNLTGSAVFTPSFLSAGVHSVPSPDAGTRSGLIAGSGSSVSPSNHYTSSPNATSTGNLSIIIVASEPATLSSGLHGFSTDATRTGSGHVSALPTGFMPAGSILGISISLNSTNGNHTSTGGWEAASSCNADWQAWSSKAITSGTVPNVSETVIYTGTYVDYVTPQNATPYTTLCDGTPRAHGEGSYSIFTNSGSYSKPSFTTATLPHITTPPCSIPATECGRLWASYSLGDIRSAPACPETCVPEYHTTWLGSSLPPCYIHANEVEVAYWPVEVEGDLCGNQTTLAPANIAIPTASTWGTTITSPGVLVSFRNIWAIDQCSSTIGDVLTGYILSQQTAQLSTKCGAYHAGGGPGTQVNFADFNSPYPASAYTCLPQCGNGVGGMENFCSTMYDNFNPLIAFPTAVFDIKPEWRSCRIEYLGDMINDPPKALTQVAAPAQPTVPTAGPGPTTPATPQQPPPQTTAKPTGGPQPTGSDPGTGDGGEDPPEGGSGGGDSPGGDSGDDGDDGDEGLGGDDDGSGSADGGSGDDDGGSGGDSGGSNTGSGGNTGGTGDNGSGGGDSGNDGGSSNDNGEYDGNGGSNEGHDDGSSGGGSNTGGSGVGSNGGGSGDGGSNDGGSDGSGAGGGSNEGGSNGGDADGGAVNGGTNDSGNHDGGSTAGSGNNGGPNSDGGSGSNGGGDDPHDSNGDGIGAGTGGGHATQNIGGVIASVLDPTTRQAADSPGLTPDSGSDAQDSSNGRAGTGAIVQLGDSQATAVAVGTDGAINIAGETLSAGQVATIDGHIVSNAGNGAVVDGSTTAPISRITAAPSLSGVVILEPSGTLTAFASGGTTVVDGQRLRPGQVKVIDGQTYSDASTALVVDGKTMAFSQMVGGASGSLTEGAVFKIGSATLTAVENAGTAIFDGHTLTSGQVITLNDHTISDAGTALVIDGQTTVHFSHLSAQPTHTIDAIFTISGHVFTATNLPNGDIIVDGTTLREGGAAITTDGVRASDGPDELVVGSSTLPVLTLSPQVTGADLVAGSVGGTSGASSNSRKSLWALGLCAFVGGLALV